MQREIRFRAWDDSKKELFEVFFLDMNGSKLNGFIIMQFTGLKDKNGKDIYEGDLSKNYYKGEWIILQIVWNPLGMWSVKWKDNYLNNYPIQNNNMEIIGNIYENPELLKP